MRGRNLFWFLSLYAWYTGDTSWRYCFNRLWPPGKICTVFHMIPAIALFFHGTTTPQWARPHHYRGFTITPRHTHTHTHTHMHTHSVELLWTSDEPVAETSTWQHTTPTRERHPCPRWDSNPQSQQASSRRPTPYANGIGLSHITYVTNSAVKTTYYVGQELAHYL